MKVWLRPLVGRFKIRVDNNDTVAVIASNLHRHGIRCTNPIPVTSDGAFYVLFAEYPEGMLETRFEQLITEIPGVNLMLDPA